MAYARAAGLQDAIELSTCLRAEDKAEIAAGSGETPLASLLRSIQTSKNPKALIHDGRVIALFGVAPTSPGCAAPWMMASPALVEVAIPFLRQGREIIEEWRKEYRLLHNTVDCRNEIHIRWLKWLGFQFIRKIPEHGVERRPFYEFVMIGANHV